MQKVEHSCIASGNALWKRPWWFLEKVNIGPYDSAIPLLSVHPKRGKAGTGTDICLPKFTAALFTMPKGGNNPDVYRWMTR